MNRPSLKVIAAAVLIPALVLAAAVDQGMPGTQGPWKVTFSGTTSTGTTATSGANVWTPGASATFINANATPCTAAGGTSCTTIFASTQVIAWPRLAITIKNMGAAAVNDVLIQFSPDGNEWEVWDSTTFAALGSDKMISIQIGDNSRRYVRIQARSATGTSVMVWLTGSQG